MKATIEVTVTLKIKATVDNQDQADTIRAIYQHAVDGEVDSALCKPVTIQGKQYTPEVVVASGIPFVEFNW